MRYVALKSKSSYLIRDLATFAVVARVKTYAQANAEAARLNAAYIQKIHERVA